MVTVGNIQAAAFQTFSASSSYGNDSLTFKDFDLALSDVEASCNPAIERADDGSTSGPYSCSTVIPERSGSAEVDQSQPAPVYTASSASRRLFRAAQPESKSWRPRSPRETGDDAKRDIGIPSWKDGAPAAGEATAATFSASSYAGDGSATTSSSDDRPTNEILDGTDVLQQISNVTSTEPSNEREVFVGGLRESEDSVHITEDELTAYFEKFGHIESVSINRDDRTHRGRGFAFVKFYSESAALNAVVADASTHVIRGTTVSVQWSRGAKDGSGDRPRRRNSSNSDRSSGNSPQRNRSSPKMGLYSGGHKGHRNSSNSSSGGNHGYSPHRSRSQGQLHGGSGSMPYGYCGGHAGDHMAPHINQATAAAVAASVPMVCVVVPAQRAAALGLPHHPTHNLGGQILASHPSRGSPPRDMHFMSVSSGSSSNRSSYPSHTRSHSHSLTTSNGHGNYSSHGHYDHQAGSTSTSHHVPILKGSHSYSGGHTPVRVPPVHQNTAQRRGRTEASPSSGHGYTDYDRTPFDMPLPSNSFPPKGWNGSEVSRTVRRVSMRSQSPPPVMRSSGRSGGGAPRPPTPPRSYAHAYGHHGYASSSSGQGNIMEGCPPGMGRARRRHSGSSVMRGRIDNGADLYDVPVNFYPSGGGGGEPTYDRDYGYAGSSRMS